MHPDAAPYNSHLGGVPIGGRKLPPGVTRIHPSFYDYHENDSRTAATEPGPMNPLTCPKCGRVCGSPIGLVSHMRTHKV